MPTGNEDADPDLIISSSRVGGACKIFRDVLRARRSSNLTVRPGFLSLTLRAYSLKRVSFPDSPPWAEKAPVRRARAAAENLLVRKNLLVLEKSDYVAHDVIACSLVPGSLTASRRRSFAWRVGSFRTKKKKKGANLGSRHPCVMTVYVGKIRDRPVIIHPEREMALSDKPEGACEGCWSEAFRPPADATRPGRQNGSV